MVIRRDLHERNRLSWNAATPAHNLHKGDQARFLREGGSTLYAEERDLLGSISGARLLHLQCNAGQDTLSLAALGAEVTGVDISDEAIAFARALSAESGLPGTFVRADIYDWLPEARERGPRFDVVFSSYGAVCWLSELAPWADGIAAQLVPGGRLVIVDYHPFLMMFDDSWKLQYPYHGGHVVSTSGVPDYVATSGTPAASREHAQAPPAAAGDFENPHPDYTFQWGLGEIVTALCAAGLRLELLREYPYANGSPGYERMRRSDDGRWWPPEDMASIPLMFGLAARQSS